MPTNPPIGPRDYYDFFPSLDHHTGDIWKGLPTHGLLNVQPFSSIVVTPSCDLSNEKTDTVTYFPIISVRSLFVMRALLPDIVRETLGQLQVIGASDLFPECDRFLPPSDDLLEKCAANLGTIEKNARIGDKEKLAKARALVGIELVKLSGKASVQPPSASLLQTLFGERLFRGIMERIITNAYRGDIHFLPADGQDLSWSGVPEHAVVLFRYAHSLPVSILDRAQDVQLADWGHEVRQLAQRIEGATNFANARPLKTQTLKPRFTGDLITRFVGMHVRLGSPDFTMDTVRGYIDQVERS